MEEQNSGILIIFRAKKWVWKKKRSERKREKIMKFVKTVPLMFEQSQLKDVGEELRKGYISIISIEARNAKR